MKKMYFWRSKSNFMAVHANLEHKKLELIQWISVVEDEDLIDKMLDVKKHESHDWWDEISDAEKEAIRRGKEDIKAGRTVPHEEVRKIYAKYLH